LAADLGGPLHKRQRQAAAFPQMEFEAGSVFRSYASNHVDGALNTILVRLLSNCHEQEEELKRRLEVLLGAKPEAAIDESRKAQVEREAQELARKERVAVAGGQLLGAALAFMGEMFAGQEETVKTREMAQVLKQQLAQCMEPDIDGRLKMSITLPDDSALNTLARSLAHIIGSHLV
jgi:hypothetical protein